MTTHNEQANPDTALVILAAGGSTRMGAPKQLLQFEGRTLLRRAAQTALATDCRPVVVVLGANAAAMRQELQGLDVTAVDNPDWQTGMAGSLRTGIEALAEAAEEEKRRRGEEEKDTNHEPGVHPALRPGGTQTTNHKQYATESGGGFSSSKPFSCLVMLCDQPFVTSALLESLVYAWRESGKRVVCCEYAGEAGVPALFDQSLFAELCSLQGAAGAKQIFARYADDTLRVPFAPAAFDVDTRQQYEALTEQVRNPQEG